MKHFFATFVLVGYVLLVPFCLYGSAMTAHAGTEEMSSTPVHHTDDCGMPFGCEHAEQGGLVDVAVHHISMYLTLSQTPLVALSLFASIFVLRLLLTTGIGNLLRTLLLPTSPSHTPRIDEPHLIARQKILAWLSLFEASPHFA